MPRELHLIPMPKSVVRSAGEFKLPGSMVVVLPAHPSGASFFGAERFILAAEPLTGCEFRIAAGPAVEPTREIRAVIDPAMNARLPEEIRRQSYRLQVTRKGIRIDAPATAGIFYGFQTLLQVIRVSRNAKNRKWRIENRKTLPCLDVADHPDFARRGVYHDTARGKVPTVETLLQLIDDLAHLKYNEFQLYIENNFEFRKFPEMYDDTDPFTVEELLLLDAACRARHMDFVPSLTSLGHFEKILLRPKFRHLAEAEPEQLKAIGAPCWHEAAPWSLCVTDPEAKKLLADMYAEFAPNFLSGQFNICCDEAYDLGRVRSKKLAAKIGTGQMYVDWINYCDGLVKKESPGRAIQMWGDIILNHPELIGQLPADATLLEWGYEHDHKFDEHCKVFAERLRGEEKNKKGQGARSFYVAPGTSSWLTLSARTKNAFGNIHNAAVAGLKYGARGILVTDWGDQGHQQMLAVSLLPFAYGAAAGWNLAATPNPVLEPRSKVEKLLNAASLQFFRDGMGRVASLAYELGLTYERLGWQRFNASLDHFLFREKWDFANYVNRAPAAALRETIATTEKLLRQFQAAQIDHLEGRQIRDEFIFTCREIIDTCRRTLLRQQWLAADPARRNPEEETLRSKAPKRLSKNFESEMKKLRGEAILLEKEFAALWMGRNKASRLADVAGEFRRLAAEYRKFAR